MLKISTVLLVALCILVHPMRIWIPYDIVRMCCLQPRTVVSSLQLYRLSTFALVHPSIYHLFLNIISFAPLASCLEVSIGSIQLLHVFSLFTTAISLLHILSSLLAFIILPDLYSTSCTLGLSSVCFALLTRQCLDKISITM